MDCKKYFYFAVLALFSSFNYGQVDEKEPPITVPKNEVGEVDFYNTDVPYSIATLTEIPTLEGCSNAPASEALKCLNEQIQKHIKKHLNYPKEAKELGIQGKVAVVFVIDKEGNCKDFKARGPKNGQLLEEEAIRVMKLLPKFTPGKMKNKTVNVHHAAVVLFQLEKKKKRG